MMPKYSVYVLIKYGDPVYIGLTTDISGRLRKHRKMGKVFDTYRVIFQTNDKKEGLLVERTLIKFLTLFSDSGLNKQDVGASLYRFYNLLTDEQRDAMQ